MVALPFTLTSLYRGYLGSHASLRDMDFSLLQLSHEWLSFAFNISFFYVEPRLAYVQSGVRTVRRVYANIRLRRP